MKKTYISPQSFTIIIDVQTPLVESTTMLVGKENVDDCDKAQHSIWENPSEGIIWEEE